MSTSLKPCGTPAAYRRHHRDGEPPCDPCGNAFREYRASLRRAGGVPKRAAITDLIEEIEWLLHLNQGSGYILQAIGYTGKEASLDTRLQRHGYKDLARRLLMMDRAAA